MDKYFEQIAKDYDKPIEEVRKLVAMGQVLIDQLNPEEGERVYTELEMLAMDMAATYNLNFEDKSIAEFDALLESFTA